MVVVVGGGEVLVQHIHTIYGQWKVFAFLCSPISHNLRSSLSVSCKNLCPLTVLYVNGGYTEYLYIVFCTE